MDIQYQSDYVPTPRQSKTIANLQLLPSYDIGQYEIFDVEIQNPLRGSKKMCLSFRKRRIGFAYTYRYQSFLVGPRGGVIRIVNSFC